MHFLLSIGSQRINQWYYLLECCLSGKSSKCKKQRHSKNEKLDKRVAHYISRKNVAIFVKNAFFRGKRVFINESRMYVFNYAVYEMRIINTFNRFLPWSHLAWKWNEFSEEFARIWKFFSHFITQTAKLLKQAFGII